MPTTLPGFCDVQKTLKRLQQHLREGKNEILRCVGELEHWLTQLASSYEGLQEVEQQARARTETLPGVKLVQAKAIESLYDQWIEMAELLWAQIEGWQHQGTTIQGATEHANHLIGAYGRCLRQEELFEPLGAVTKTLHESFHQQGGTTGFRWDGSHR